jgi:hypothetical protein
MIVSQFLKIERVCIFRNRKKFKIFNIIPADEICGFSNFCSIGYMKEMIFLKFPKSEEGEKAPKYESMLIEFMDFRK